MKNPNWVRDEIILALELYLRDKTTAGNDTHPEVIKLSKLLNSLPIFPIDRRTSTFRNENGVGMKIANLQRMDPSYGGTGLTGGNGLEKNVWEDFYSNPEFLNKTAKAIRETYKMLDFSALQLSDYFANADPGISVMI